MEFVLGLMAGVASFAFVTVYGIAFVDGGRMFLKRDPGSTQVSTRTNASTAPAFTPLDLGEPTMKWPSQNPHPRKALPPLPWPSETWTDDYFGRKGGQNNHGNLQTSVAAVTSATEDAWHNGAVQVEATPVPKKQVAKPAAKPKQQSAAPAAKAKSGVARPPATAPKTTSGSLSEADIIAIVEREGLAAAVERVRAQNGWDFQQAATHIAQVLRSRRGRS